MTDTKVQFPDVSRFSAVDEIDRPQQLIEVLDIAKRLPGFPEAKAQLLARLKPEHASSAIDVGCGYGADVIEIAKRLRPGGSARSSSTRRPCSSITLTSSCSTRCGIRLAAP